MQALNWLNNHGHILRGAIQPMDRFSLRSYRYRFHYRCSVTRPYMLSFKYLLGLVLG